MHGDEELRIRGNVRLEILPGNVVVILRGS